MRLSPAVSLVFVLACSRDPAGIGPRDPAPEDIPVAVEIAGGPVVSGFQRGHLRAAKTVGKLRVSRHPTTVAQYRACVNAGACAAPALASTSCDSKDPRTPVDHGTYDGAPDLPITCTTAEQAKAFCAWVGGALPTPEEWLLAARGPDVARYAWGDARPTCERHPEASEPCGGTFAIARHPQGKSALGIEDVMLTRAELLASHAAAQFPRPRATGERAPPISPSRWRTCAARSARRARASSSRSIRGAASRATSRASRTPSATTRAGSAWP
jgi:formylglycine-generating enzyme required for sulfatase activity